MAKTVTLITSQYRCDRLIHAASTVAGDTGSDLTVVGVMDSEYELNPQAIEYLFGLARQNGATMRLMFTEDKVGMMHEIVGRHDTRYIVTGMPGSNRSVLYDLWKQHPGKTFYTVDPTGELIEVAGSRFCTA